MKRLVLPLTLSIAAAMTSCKEVVYKKIDDAQLKLIEDSIPRIVPGVSTIHTIQNMQADVYSSVKIVLGDIPFYSASPETQRQVANKAAITLLRIMGPDNNLTKDTLTITMNVRDNLDNPPDAINIVVNIDSLKKIVYPASK